MTDKYYIPYFTHGELACHKTHKIKLAEGFGDKLVALRKEYGLIMPVTSGCRSKEYNRSIGGHYRSLHVYDEPHHQTGGCCAVDVRMEDGVVKGHLVATAWKMGWSIGVHGNFVHLDMRSDYTDLPQAFFTYNR